MAIKMIVMDMDGTLYRKDSTLDPLTVEALLECQKQGIRLVLASGRNCDNLRHVAAQLHMEESGYIVGLNGLEVLRLSDGKRQVDGQLNAEDAKKVFRLAHKYHLKGIAFTFGSFYFYVRPLRRWFTRLAFFINSKRKDVGFEGTMEGSYLNHAEEVIKEPITKLDFEGARVPALKQQLHQKLPEYELMLVGVHWLEIMKKGVSKGKGVMQVAADCQIKSDEIMCFGDAENDLSMIEAVKYGVAMGNAMENVKERAYYVTDTNMNHGIAKAIEHFKAELYRDA